MGKAAQMGLALALVQVSFEVLHPGDFVILNQVVFVVALSTVVSYPAQVAIWHQDWVNARSLYRTALLLSTFAFIAAGGVTIVRNALPASVAIAVVLYGLAKFHERIVFNYYNTLQRYPVAYATSIAVLGGELVAFLAVSAVVGPSLIARFGYSGVVMLVVLAFIFRQPDLQTFLRVTATSELVRDFRLLCSTRNMVVVCYIATVLMCTMVDRYFIGMTAIPDVAASDYLLLLAYASAIHTLFTSVLDWYRPKAFAILDASSSDDASGMGRLAEIRRRVLLTLMGSFIVFGAAGFGFFGLLSIDLPLWPMIWALLVAAFSLFHLASVIQVEWFFKKRYPALLGVWVCALSAKGIYLMVFHSRVSDFAVSQVVSAAAIVVVTGVCSWLWRLPRGTGAAG